MPYQFQCQILTRILIYVLHQWQLSTLFPCKLQSSESCPPISRSSTMSLETCILWKSHLHDPCIYWIVDVNKISFIRKCQVCSITFDFLWVKKMLQCVIVYQWQLLLNSKAVHVVIVIHFLSDPELFSTVKIILSVMNLQST